MNLVPHYWNYANNFIAVAAMIPFSLYLEHQSKRIEKLPPSAEKERAICFFSSIVKTINAVAALFMVESAFLTLGKSILTLAQYKWTIFIPLGIELMTFVIDRSSAPEKVKSIFHKVNNSVSPLCITILLVATVAIALHGVPAFGFGFGAIVAGEIIYVTGQFLMYKNRAQSLRD
jgi:hypothetical protein